MYKRPHKNNKKKNKVIQETKIEKIVETKHSYLELPIKDIKLDLIGMLIFAVISFISILFLKRYNVDLSTILNLFNR